MDADLSSAVQISGLHHVYGRVAALGGIALEIPAGRMTGLIGPDGVGKSSLLALIAGARRIQTGRVVALGGDMADRRHRETVQPRIAYMPQGLGKNLYMDLTVFENLEFFARLFGQDRAEREARIAMLLAATGLAPFPDRPAGKLSGGMKQKLGLCCALIHDPDLLLLDEPTTGVDPLSRRQFWRLIDRIRRERPGMTVVVATAYMEEAAEFDWLVAMNAGQVLACGTPAKLQGDAETLEAAFVRLLPDSIRREHRQLEIPPRPPTADGSAIGAQGLSKRFGKFTAVDRVSFEIERGEIFGFLGSNGCGKTTTMKMLTGLLEPSEGKVHLFGRRMDARDLGTRRRVGYMSQSFSLYGELSVRQNLELHARLFHVPPNEIEPRIVELARRFGLDPHMDAWPPNLPLGVRQRLSLAVAVIHEPEILILDEPTSGVDPVARDQFWELLVDLSRNRGVTIFISTHFMNEGARCDRISLMHAGRVLATGTPAELVAGENADSLEDAFISALEAVAEIEPPQPVSEDATDRLPATARTPRPLARNSRFSPRRLFAYSLRETKEVLRDPVRLGFALLGTILLMLVFSFGISTDVENLTYAALDQDDTPESRRFLEGLTGSRYFLERERLVSFAALERRMQSGEITLAIVIPPHFGKDLLRGATPEIAAWIDGAMPFRAETVRGYVDGVYRHYLVELYTRIHGEPPSLLPVDIEMRFKYNQDFKSIYAMVPSVIALLLVFIPAILTAVGVVREKELGSIINLYVTPVTRLEFLLGKQIPYVIIGMIDFLLLAGMAVFIFDVPVRGDFFALGVGALLYVGATTGLGLLVSTFTRSQIAALVGTAIVTMLPAVQFSGMLQPVSSLQGSGAVVGAVYPTAHFLAISVGTFTKGLGFADLSHNFLALLPAAPLLLLLSAALLPRQER